MLTTRRQKGKLRFESNGHFLFHPRSVSDGRIDCTFETAFMQAP